MLAHAERLRITGRSRVLNIGFGCASNGVVRLCEASVHQYSSLAPTLVRAAPLLLRAERRTG